MHAGTTASRRYCQDIGDRFGQHQPHQFGSAPSPLPQVWAVVCRLRRPRWRPACLARCHTRPTTIRHDSGSPACPNRRFQRWSEAQLGVISSEVDEREKTAARFRWTALSTNAGGVSRETVVGAYDYQGPGRVRIWEIRRLQRHPAHRRRPGRAERHHERKKRKPAGVVFVNGDSHSGKDL